MINEQHRHLHCSNCPVKNKSILCQLSNGSLDNINKHKTVNTYKKGQTIFVKGSPSYGAYCIKQGKIKLSTFSSNGKESIHRLALAGETLGHVDPFIDEEYSTSTATALEDSIVCFIDKWYMQKIIKEEPSIAYHIIKQLSKELEEAERKVTSFHQKNVRERLAELLLTFKESFGVQEDNSCKLDIKLTREETASMIGTATETLIRLLSDFKHEHLIEQKGKTLYIVNEDKLNQVANCS